MVGLGLVRSGTAVMARSGMARYDKFRYGTAVAVWHGSVRRGKVRRSKVRFGTAVEVRFGITRRGKVRFGSERRA